MIECHPLGVEIGQGLAWGAGYAPVWVCGNAVGKCFERHIEVDDAAACGKIGHRLIAVDNTPARPKNAAADAQRLYDPRFKLNKALLVCGIDHILQPVAVTGFDHMVAVDVGPAQTVSESLAYCCFSGAWHTDERNARDAFIDALDNNVFFTHCSREPLQLEVFIIGPINANSTPDGFEKKESTP